MYIVYAFRINLLAQTYIHVCAAEPATWGVGPVFECYTLSGLRFV